MTVSDTIVTRRVVVGDIACRKVALQLLSAGAHHEISYLAGVSPTIPGFTRGVVMSAQFCVESETRADNSSSKPSASGDSGLEVSPDSSS